MTALLLDALAAYRLTRLVTKDSILDGPRDALVRYAYDVDDGDRTDTPGSRTSPGTWADFASDDPEAPKLAKLVTCRWCAGMWISLGVVAARWAFPTAWPPLAKALAFSAGAALLANLED